ncbi:hypothetical protein E5676_scaffold832G00410 [Cucumis melo var. makuwa]|uniref:Uncharacterized protein n=1 Tax=Cucumis melo var. makuwa TaxID=1194695 RepID=A0A5A7T6N3_CUCMM|nr:hypothetical protein E6C27_scaffold379G001320 [Cucumis melo var. makuwa]TYK13856.1 hypothetical protein E5676_scaffold832G00410 [Cucumis melo var. makuwa]
MESQVACVAGCDNLVIVKIMLLRRGRGARSGSRAIIEPIMDLEAHSVNPDVRREQEETVYDRVAQRLIKVMGS